MNEPRLTPIGKENYDRNKVFCGHALEPQSVKKSTGTNIQCKDMFCTLHPHHVVVCSVGKVSCEVDDCPMFGKLRDVLVKADRRFI